MADHDMTSEMGSSVSRKRKASSECTVSCVSVKRRSPRGKPIESQESVTNYEQAFSIKDGCERYYGTKLENDLLNAYLDMFLPQSYIRHNSIERMICDMSCMREFNTDPSSLFRTISTGSQVQGLSIPTYSLEYGKRVEFFGPDVDMLQLNMNAMEMFDGSPIPRYELRPFDDNPNYVRLIQNGGWTDDENGKMTVWHIDNECLGQTVKNTEMTRGVLSKDSNTLRDGLGQLDSLDIHGPAINFATDAMSPLNAALNKSYFPEEHLRMDRGDVDLCLGMGFEGWPDVATNFIKRYRPSGWPDQDLINRAVSHGYAVTPVGRAYSPTKEQEWRFSFSDAERILANNISDRQRTVFILVKILHCFFFKEPAIFKTYFLKTLLFWLCERIPREHWEGSKIQMVCVFLDEMVHALATGYLGDYFMKGANLLAGILPSFRKTLASRVVWVKSHIFAAFRIVESQIQFHGEVDCPVNTDTLVEYSLKTQYSNRQSTVVHEILTEAYFEFVLSVAIDLTDIISRQPKPNVNNIQYWQIIAAINTALAILVEAFRKYYRLSCQTEEEGMSTSGLVLCIESTLKNDIKYINASARAKVLCMLYHMDKNGNEQEMIPCLNYISLLPELPVFQENPSAVEKTPRDTTHVEPEQGSSKESCDPENILSPSDWLKENIKERGLHIKKFKPVLSRMEKVNYQDMRRLDNSYVFAQLWELVEKQYAAQNN